MEEKKVCLSERDLMGAIGFWAYSQCPYRLPRKIEIVMEKVKAKIREQFVNMNEWYYIEIEPSKVYGLVNDLLFSIPEWQEWNLTLNEYEKGIKVDDEIRPQFGFTSAYDKETGDSWKNDFVDLDAFVRNVCRMIDLLNAEDERDMQAFMSEARV